MKKVTVPQKEKSSLEGKLEMKKVTGSKKEKSSLEGSLKRR